MNAFSTTDLINFARRPIHKKEIKKNIINPIFDKCLQYIDPDDKKWKQIFEKAGSGRFPPHVKYDIDDNILTYNRQKYKEHIKIPIDTIEATNAIIEFFKKFCHIYSEKDKYTNGRIKFDDITWKEIKSINKRTHMINEFAHSLCKRYGVEIDKFFNHIKTKINVGLLLGKITNENIHLQGERILNINNLLWNVEKSYLYIDTKPTRKTKNTKKNTKLIISDKSLFYIKNMDQMMRTHIDLSVKVTSCCEQYVGRKKDPTKTTNITNNKNIIGDIDITDSTNTDITDLTITNTENTANT